jgi:hypothetical protein
MNRNREITQFAAVLEGHFVDNGGKQPPLDVVEGSLIPEVSLLVYPVHTSRENFAGV